MNEYDQALLHGFALGAIVTGTISTGLWIVRDWLQGSLCDLPVRSDWPEHPIFQARGCGSPSAKADTALKHAQELPPACADGEVISKLKRKAHARR